MLSPLNATPELNASSRQSVLASVGQLQLWVGDDTCLDKLSIGELLILQSKLEAQTVI